MSEHKTLLQFLLDLLHDKDALADFQDHPQAALHAAGLDHVCVQDIQDLLPTVLEKADPEQCAKYEDDCDNDNCHDDAPKHHDGHHSNHHWGDPGCDDDDKSHHHHDNEIDKVITHLNYVTNNYSFVDNSHETIFNTSNNVWASGHAHVDITNENHNASDGGVNIEGDNNAPVATGGHNVIGDGNEIAGDGANAAFGAGSTALSHVGTGDGGAISTGLGSAIGHNAPLTNFGDGATVAGEGSSLTDVGNDQSTTQHDVGNTTTTQHDVGNTTTTQHDVGNTNTDTDTDNSSNGSGNLFSSVEQQEHHHHAPEPTHDLVHH